jgi:hypothetical protein
MSGLIMTEEIATADAEAGKISVDKTNISVTDFAQRANW